MKLTRATTRTALAALTLAALGATGMQGAAARVAPAGPAPAGAQPAAQPGAQPAHTGGAPTLGAAAARQHLRIGTAVDTDALAADPAYNARIGTEFSTVTPENVMKWQLIEPTRGQLDFAAADRLVAFARAHGQLVRGHTLIWHNQLPTWLTDGVANGSISPTQLRGILRQHIRDEVGHFRGKIWQWDVVNEAFNDDGTPRQTIWLQQLGPGYIADAFRWAHEADPKALLFYNDYNIEGVNAKSDATYALVRQLRRDGVPIQGVGVQGHFGVQFGFPGDVRQNLDRFAALGLFTAVTEADVRMPLPKDVIKEQAQAQGYNVLLQACLLSPRCLSLTVWGFTDKYSWVPGVFAGQGAATLFTEDLVAKPAYQALLTDLAVANRGR
ncbi:MAG TPA: endo-1,4-beta-xylanase [Mycobacteriales bacterium]|nr:endo-1,4-beta-xylanase [Mycobacteriales bacterium]